MGKHNNGKKRYHDINDTNNVKMYVMPIGNDDLIVDRYKENKISAPIIPTIKKQDLDEMIKMNSEKVPARVQPAILFDEECMYYTDKYGENNGSKNEVISSTNDEIRRNMIDINNKIIDECSEKMNKNNIYSSIRVCSSAIDSNMYMIIGRFTAAVVNLTNVFIENVCNSIGTFYPPTNANDSYIDEPYNIYESIRDLMATDTDELISLISNVSIIDAIPLTYVNTVGSLAYNKAVSIVRSSNYRNADSEADISDQFTMMNNYFKWMMADMCYEASAFTTSIVSYLQYIIEFRKSHTNTTGMLADCALF